MRHVRVAAVQLEVVIGDVERNLAESERLAREAAAEGAELVAVHGRRWYGRHARGRPPWSPPAERLEPAHHTSPSRQSHVSSPARSSATVSENT